MGLTQRRATAPTCATRLVAVLASPQLGRCLYGVAENEDSGRVLS